LETYFAGMSHRKQVSGEPLTRPCSLRCFHSAAPWVCPEELAVPPPSHNRETETENTQKTESKRDRVTQRYTQRDRRQKEKTDTERD
jgi:hypothetical protein